MDAFKKGKPKFPRIKIYQDTGGIKIEIQYEVREHVIKQCFVLKKNEVKVPCLSDFEIDWS